MLVSIIIPIYNVASYIEKCLLSVLNQTYQDIEIILVDDCTQDNSMEIVGDVLLNTNPKPKIIRHEVNRGLAVSRNSGLQVAMGEYVYFLDSDDWISFDCIEKLVCIAKKYNLDVAVGGVCEKGINHKDLVRFNSWWHNSSNIILLKQTEIFLYMNNGNVYIESWNKLMRKKILDEFGLIFNEGILYEDVIWMFNLCRRISSLGITNEITYYYRKREGSIMAKSRNRDFHSHFYNSYRLFQSILDEWNKDAYLFSAQYFYLHLNSALYHSADKEMLKEILFNNRLDVLLGLRLLLKSKMKFWYLICPLILPLSLLRFYTRIINKCRTLF